MRRLSDRKNNQISVKYKAGARLRNDRIIRFSRQFRKFNSRNRIIPENANRLNMPEKPHPLGFGMGIFEGEGRHLLGSSPVHDMHFFSTKPYSGNRCVNSGVSRTYDNYASGYSGNFTRFVAGDEIQRICHSIEPLARYTKLTDRSKADSEKDRIVTSLNLSQPLRINPRSKLKIHSKLGKHIDLT